MDTRSFSKSRRRLGVENKGGAELAPSELRRIRFVPKMPFRNWLMLLDCADVLLDTFPFGAYTSTFEAFSCCGTPAVTLPSRQTKMVTAAGVYRKLGLSNDLTASSPAEYAAMAVRVATNATLQMRLRTAIRTGVMGSNVGVYDPDAVTHAGYFEDVETVRAWERFMCTAVKQVELGEVPHEWIRSGGVAGSKGAGTYDEEPDGGSWTRAT